jgi:hypothetical protein
MREGEGRAATHEAIMIRITRTFERVTEESAEHGEAVESGYIVAGELVTFRELVNLLRFGVPSSCPASGSPWEWVTHDDGPGKTRALFERGERESYSVHYSRDNPERHARYWRLAFIAAGLIRSTSITREGD